MTKLAWNHVGTRTYHAGVDRGVIYPKTGPAIPWSGLTSVSESPSGVDSRLYLDGVNLRNRYFENEFSLTVEAFTYPDFLDEENTLFDFSYRTRALSDISESYQIHLVYNAIAVPDPSDYETLDRSTEINSFTWTLITRPQELPGFKPSSHLIIDGDLMRPEFFEIFEEIIYGSDSVEPSIPSAPEILEIFRDNSVVIIDHRDGTWSAEGPSYLIRMVDDTQFEIDSRNITYINDHTYMIDSDEKVI